MSTRYFNATGWAGSHLLTVTQTDGYLTAPAPRVAAGSSGNTVAIWGIDAY